MNHRIMMELVLTVCFHDLLQVSSQEYCHQVIHYPSNSLIKIVTCQIIEYLTQEGISLWNQTSSLFTTEVLGCVIVQSGCKHTIGNSLGIDIRKVGWLQFLNEYILESLILPTKIVVGITHCIIVHRLLNDIL